MSPAPRAKKSVPDAPETAYINRELSWVEFNARVLSEALNERNPLLDRLKFIAIVSSNFDEFFMVRVASLMREARRGNKVACPSGLSPSEVISRLMTRVRELVDLQYATLKKLEVQLRAAGVTLLLGEDEWSEKQREYLDHCFESEIFPALTPVGLPPGGRFPFTGNLRLHVAFILRETEPSPGKTPEDKYAIVQIPGTIDRLWAALDEKPWEANLKFVVVEDIIRAHADRLFPGYQVTDFAAFRVTRDADMAVDEDDDVDFMNAMEEVITSREHSRPVRLQIHTTSDRLRQFLIAGLDAGSAEIFMVDGPLELRAFMGVAGKVKHPDSVLSEEDWPPVNHPDLLGDEPIWDILKRRDILLHHPYQSFDPVVNLISAAADDPRTLAIKTTLYRTSGRSPIVRALARAAEAGKQVTALVELKARFDEERNMQWARQLEAAGVIVIYGIARLKVHSKAVMIVRREDEGIARYAHLGTGNYNDSTARLYTDMGIMTSDDKITYEVARFFNAITGHTTTPNLRQIVMAPLDLRDHIKMCIAREVELHSPDNPGQIIAKMNALVDPEIISLLLDAADRGVQIRLNVRGICCLRIGDRPGARNIRIVSIVDRFLEHTRIFYFHNAGRQDIYLASADWMPRNLDARVELMFPVPKSLQPTVLQALDFYFRDNANAHLMRPDGSYERLSPAKGKKPFRSQEAFYREAKRRAAAAAAAPKRDFDVRRSQDPAPPRPRRKTK